MARPQEAERNADLIRKWKASKSKRGRQKELARYFRISEGRVSQIIKQYALV